METNVKAAIVHDALPFFGGAERTLGAMLEVLPNAPVYTLIHNPAALRGTALEAADIHSTWLQSLPGIRNNHYRFFPLFPSALKSIRLPEVDLIVASSYALAHWIPKSPAQRLLVYCHTPLRYLWSQRQVFMARLPAPLRPLASAFLKMLRRKDRQAALRASAYTANSAWVADQIRRYYGIRATVIHPPVDTDRFAPGAREDFFLCLTRLAPHKRVELVVQAFNELGLPLVIAGDGPEGKKLRRLAENQITFLGHVSDREAGDLLARAKGMVHMAAEDFGIAMVEAQAAGCPVIAFRGGANLETIVEGKTGVYADEQSQEGLVRAVQNFLNHNEPFRPDDIRTHALRFSKDKFLEKFRKAVLRCVSS